MKRRGLPSPDRADALALTFAYPVMVSNFEDDDDQRHTANATTGY
jgi:hypothetical protein